MHASCEKEVTCPLHTLRATMMQTFAAPAYNIVLIVYLLSLPPACGQIMDHLNIVSESDSDMGAL